MKASAFPYQAFKGTAAWKLIDTAIDGLVDNHDLIEQTARQYIVGYLVKRLAVKRMLTADALRQERAKTRSSSTRP